ncbi:FtsW/RodA/SpoVE family cell cycle protein [Chitinivibrio alkaliphilus]|uniref:Probable peptidoglycan glycosyltransferase FtsW n=1 Tax=Chitinivibrio alkaliphilus ACht1 TaxID=1313304 RepID=U7D5G7_9BACT|nr:putative peptidoglycan glycosyltransferase FtsW [Chitinivibrio alkaliphilus]ERP31198.1 cell division protein FtsW [Chitinivibrio alkaliphilus ACht1]
MGRVKQIDVVLLVAVLLLVFIGFVQLYSSSYVFATDRFNNPTFFVVNQLKRGLVGVILAVGVMCVNYKKVVQWGGWIYLLSVCMLLYALTPLVPEINNTKRWISIFGFALQVSEFAKLGLVLLLAKILSQRTLEQVRTLPQFLVLWAVILLVVLLVALAPDFSSAVFIFLAGFLMLFVAGVRKTHLLIVFLSTLLVGIVYMNQREYRVQRMTAFFNREAGVQDSNFQLRQALNAIGHGGIFGQGLGQGIQKRGFVPEPHTDFIFSSFAEEFGFVGGAILLFLFILVFLRGFRIARQADDMAGTYLALGLTAFLVMNFVAHTAVNIGLMPTTGIPLPFMSYGGMNLMVSIFSVGLLLNISTFAPREVL